MLCKRRVIVSSSLFFALKIAAWCDVRSVARTVFVRENYDRFGPFLSFGGY